MVTTLVDTYRFDDGKLVIHPEPLVLEDLVKFALSQCAPLIDEKGIIVDNSIQGRSIIFGDAKLIQRVLLNIFHNAIKNLSLRGTIHIKISCDLNAFILTINDNGSGISPHDLPHLFERYFVGKSDDRYVGFGLGLYLCKQIMLAHHGNISIESLQDVYTEARLQFPCKNEII